MRKIMIVDDTESVRESVDFLLSDRYEIIKADGVKTMFKNLKETIPDLILLDIMMPDGNGMTVKTRLKGMPEYKDIPIVFLTAVEDDKVRNLAKIQAEAYINKPFTEEELISVIKATLKD